MRQHHRAFSLIELLVVLGMIAMLAGLLLPVLHKARQCARAASAASAMRQVITAYTAYHLENDGALLFGFTPPTVNGVPITAEDPVTSAVYGSPVADRYPWRLTKYLRHAWRTLHYHDTTPAVPSIHDTSSAAFMKAYSLSVSPSFGINSIFLGGHAGGVFHGFAGPAGDAPNTGRHVAFRASEIRQPQRQIVFVEVVGRNSPSLASDNDPAAGFHFAMPPRAAGSRWVVSNGKPATTSGMITGLPTGRASPANNPRIPTAFFDGHVEFLSPTDLLDMRLWAPRATSPTYDF